MRWLELIQKEPGYPAQTAQTAIAKAKSAKDVFISTCDERAQVEAELSALRHKKDCRLGPLDGVPIAWKDNIDLKGVATTGGTMVLRHNRPKADAALVNRLTQCGVVNIGKTNMSELAYSGLGLNPHYGTPPAESPGRQAPGGSSSGSAVAVARGIVPIAMGSDTAGSLRVPAAFNGLCAYRPSVGRHSFDGIMPLAPTMDTAGFLAREPEDIIAVEQALVPTKWLSSEISELVTVYDPHWLQSENISDDVRTSFYNHLTELRELGVVVVEKELPVLRDFFGLLDQYGWLGAYEAVWQCRQLMDAHPQEDFDVRVWDRLHSVADHRFDRVVALTEGRKVLLRAIQDQLGSSILLMPTVAHTAPDLEKLEKDSAHFAKTNMATLRLTMFGSFLDTPAFALPVGKTPEGQFCSVQWLAPQGKDERVLRAVHLLSTRRKHL